MEKGKTKHFEIENQIGELPLLAEKVEKLAWNWELSDSVVFSINLVLEEALSNIIFYGFSDNGKHSIKISLSLKNKQLTVKIADDGIPFNPFSCRQPDITLPLEERPIGGLGIFLIAKMMDTVHYARKQNLNILSLNKNL
jgi:serine/threonine-protein kinase RsbW